MARSMAPTVCLVAVLIVIAVVLGVFAEPARAAGAGVGHAPWQRPVPGAVLGTFHLSADRYARGQHRGVDLAAPPGAPVRAACGGRVSFAGRVPGGGRTVSVRCGRLVATYQHLGGVAVRRGQAVVAGTALGAAGRSGRPRTGRVHVHLGARVAATGRYVDPLSLLGRRSPGFPALAPPRRPSVPPGGLGPAPRPASPSPRAPAGTLVPIAPAPAPEPTGARTPAGARVAPGGAEPAPPPAGLPWTAWAGLGCLAPAIGLGGLERVRARRRGASMPEAAHAPG